MTFIIAEIGVNWDGDFDVLKEMMTHAKKAVCNAVKFQAFNEELIHEHPEKERLLKSAISEENIEEINYIAKKVGIEWFCTPMYPEVVEILEPFVKRYKIREIDGRLLLENKVTPLLEKVFATEKEVFVSSKLSPDKCKFYSNKKIKWLYCIPKYPCEVEDLDFSNIRNFNGYSNHYKHIIAPLTAMILGANIIEIHITSDINKEFFDNNVSFDYNELAEFTKLCRIIDKIKK